MTTDRYPIQLRLLLDKTPRLMVSERTDWGDIAQRSSFSFTGDDVRDLQLRRVADKLAREFTKHVFDHALFDQRAEADGLITKAVTYAFTYDELMLLLYTAYGEGQSSVTAYRPPMEF